MKLRVLFVAVVVAALFAIVALTAVNGRAANRNSEISIVRVPHGGIQPQAVVAAGILHLLYFSGDAKAGDLFYVKSANWGASWSAPMRVNSEPGSAFAIGTIRGGQIALGRNGRVHVAWNGSPITESRGPLNPEAGKRGAPMLYSRLNDDGTAFESERTLMTRTFGLDGGGNLAADTVGNVYVAWHGKAPGAVAGEAGRQVWLVISRDDGKTFGAEQPAWDKAKGACGCCGLALFADSKGLVRGLYRSATENVHRDIWLLTSPDGGRSFAGRKLHTWDINACPMSSMAFSEGAVEVFGAWETGGQVYFQQLTKTDSAPVSAPGGGGGRKHPRIAVGQHGDVLMIWTEGTGWQKGGSLAWQLYAANGEARGERGGVAVGSSGLPVWSFGAVVARPGGFVVLY
jgi:hypothetical protein